MRIITFGTFDLFHIGHLRLLKRARELGDHLTVGISTDKLNFSKKGIYPFHSEADRMEIVAGLKYVDAVFAEHSLEEKPKYIHEHNADILVMGHDWEGRFDHMNALCKVIYLPRTDGISSTDIKLRLANSNGT